MSPRDDDIRPGTARRLQLAGTLDRLVIHSAILEANPLGDPARRPLLVYRPPGIRTGQPRSQQRVPSLYMLQGFAGQIDDWLAATPPAQTIIELMDAMFAAGECPPAVIVFVDAWTSRGGSQFLNSTSSGRYLDYLCDEVIPFVDSHYPTLASRESRGVSGKSSGGYGAMIIPMLRPAVFGALASHAGDALFECCYQPFFPHVVRVLRDRFAGSWDAFLDQASTWPHADAELRMLFAAYGTACAYSPDPARPGRALMPFDIGTGRPREAIWSRWLALDPVRLVEKHAEELRGMRRIHLDAGRRDEFFLDLGARAVSDELSRLNIEHSLELFDGAHEDASERIPAALRDLVLALDTR